MSILTYTTVQAGAIMRSHAALGLSPISTAHASRDGWLNEADAMD